MATQLGAVAETGTVRGRMGHGSLAVTSICTHRVADADRVAARYMGQLLDWWRGLPGCVRCAPPPRRRRRAWTGSPTGTRGASSGPGAHPGRIALTRRAPR